MLLQNVFGEFLITESDHGKGAFITLKDSPEAIQQARKRVDEARKVGDYYRSLSSRVGKHGYHNRVNKMLLREENERTEAKNRDRGAVSFDYAAAYLLGLSEEDYENALI